MHVNSKDCVVEFYNKHILASNTLQQIYITVEDCALQSDNK